MVTTFLIKKDYISPNRNLVSGPASFHISANLFNVGWEKTVGLHSTCCYLLFDEHKENVTSHRYVAGKGGGLADPPERVLGIPGILRPHSDDAPLDSG